MKISAISTFVVLSVLAVAASAQTTPAPTSAQTTPVPTTVKPASTPAPTTVKPASTPAATTTKPSSTPAATTTKPAATPATTTTKNCWNVSVERDATYCITGPICSGNGKTPAGTACPKKGDVAVDRCLSYLDSYVSAGKCVAPVDAECKVIKTGAWGCVLKGSNSTGGGSGTAGNTTTNSTKPSNGTITATKLTNLSGTETAAGSSVGTIAAIAGVAAVVCAAIGTVLYKKQQQQTTAQNEAADEVVDVVTP